MKVEADFGRRNINLGTTLFSPRFPKPVVTRVGALEKGKQKLFDVELLAPPLQPSLKFDNSLGDYILLIDPLPFPTTNFLPSTEALALIDRRGRNMNIPDADIPSNGNMLLDEDDGDKEGTQSKGVVEVILEEGITMQRHTTKQPKAIVIDLDSDSDNDCSIDFSVLGMSVTCPPVQSITSVVVKKEPISPEAPGLPTLWGDFVSPKDAHELYVKKHSVYTTKRASLSGVDIPSSLGT